MLLIIAIFLICSTYYFISRRKPFAYPPGPISFPIIGHIPYFAKYSNKGGIQQLFMTWKQKYGNMVGVSFGTFEAIVLGDLAVIKEAFNLTQLTGRIQIPKVILRSSNGKGGPTRGVLFTHGRAWTEQRIFMMKHLKKYGSTSLDEIILPECAEVIARIGESEGIPVSTAQLFNPAIINVIQMIVAGDRFSHDDRDLNKVMEAITEMMQDKGVGTVISYLPQWIVDRFSRICGWDAYRECVKIPKKFFMNLVDERIEKYKDGSTKDFIDSYIGTIKGTEDIESSFYADAGKENLVHMILDFFDAGVETTSTVLSWLLLFLALNLEAQKKFQSEIDEVIQNRRPCLSDRSAMPYGEAVVQETLRMSSAVPLALFHRALDDVCFQSFNIPKDTILIPNLYGIHHDPVVWGASAQEFKPERFLCQNGLQSPASRNALPFGAGKRLCPGENLAKSELFLLATSTIQRFSVLVDPDSPLPTMDQEVGGIIAPPKPHKIVFKKRTPGEYCTDY